jgi:glycosyltransferase involved in cell wall biosynthesis
MKSPDISVVITNYNYGTYIRRCLRSLLNQDLDRGRYELIVVDDHSTDDSMEAIETFKGAGSVLVVANERNLGVGGCARVGVDHSRGKYFVRVDADDYVQPPFLSMLYNFLRFCPQYVGVSCDYFITDNDERILSVESFKENGLACGLMLRTSYLERIGSYNKKKKVFEDRDLFERIDRAKVFHLPVPLYNYVKHGGSLTDRARRPRRVSPARNRRR